MPQPSIRSSTKAESTGGASHTINEPMDAASGDRCELIVYAGDSGSASIDTPTGFTQVEAETNAEDIVTKRFFRELDGLESWPLTISQTGATGRLLSQLLCFDPNGGSGWTNEADGGGPTTVNSNTSTPPSVIGVADCIYITMYGNDQNRSVDTAPSGMVEAEVTSATSGSLATYTEQRGSGAVQKALVWGGTARGLHGYAMILSIGGGGNPGERRRRDASAF